MLRWAIRAVAANSYKNKAISASSKASSKANDAKRKFSNAKREKDVNKKLDYLRKNDFFPFKKNPGYLPGPSNA